MIKHCLGILSSKMRQMGTLLFVAIAAAVAAALSENRQVLSRPDVPVVHASAEVRIKAVERKAEMVVEQGEVAAASDAVAIVCGEDAATAELYEARNDALRSIARRRDLPKGDVAALLAYLRRADSAMRVERVAALKNDVMNLLRRQELIVAAVGVAALRGIKGQSLLMQ